MWTDENEQGTKCLAKVTAKKRNQRKQASKEPLSWNNGCRYLKDLADDYESKFQLVDNVLSQPWTAAH